MNLLLVSLFVAGAIAGPINTNQCITKDISMIDTDKVNVFVFFDPSSESAAKNAQAYDKLLTDLQSVDLPNTAFYSILKKTPSDKFHMDEVKSNMETIADEHKKVYTQYDSDYVQIWKKYEAKDQEIYIMNECGGLIDHFTLKNKWDRSYIQNISQTLAVARQSTCGCPHKADTITIL